MGTTADFSGFTAGLSTMPSESCSTMPHSIADPPGGRVDRSGRDEQDLAGLERYRWLALDLILQRAFESFSCGPLCTPFTSSRTP